MNLKDLYETAIKKKRKIERVKAGKKLAVGMGVTGAAIGVIVTTMRSKKMKNMKREEPDIIEKIKNTLGTEADTIKNATLKGEQELSKAIKDVNEKTENVKEEMKDGIHDTKKDIEKTVKNITKELDSL